MKKFLLVIFVGMVLAMNLYGIVDKIMTIYGTNDVETIDKGYTIVYME